MLTNELFAQCTVVDQYYIFYFVKIEEAQTARCCHQTGVEEEGLEFFMIYLGTQRQAIAGGNGKFYW